MVNPPPQRRLYGRKQTRPLGHDRQEVVDRLLPTLGIHLADHQIAPVDLFNKAFAQTWLEIGFGTGEHVAALMRAHPDRAYLAAEPFINGMGAFPLRNPR